MKPEEVSKTSSAPRFDPGLVCLCILLIIAPVKFGAVIGTGGIPMFPLSPIEWVFGLWPPFLATGLAGICLIVVTASQHSRLPNRDAASWLPIAPAGLLLIGAIPGFLNTTEWATAIPMAWQLIGVFAVAVAVHIQVHARPDSLKWLLLAIVIGGIFCCWGTIEQVLWGFDRTKAAVEEMVKSGQRVPPALMSRASQTRAFAYFTYPNNLAAHFLVVIPIMVAAAHRFGLLFEPKKVSSILLPAMTLLLGAWCFIQTKSLGGTVAIAGAVGGILAIQVFRSGKKGSIKLVAVLALTSLVIIGTLATRESGRLKSVEARMEYYKCAAQMTVNNPILGSGWGEFYPSYMRLKNETAEETRLPHNLLLSFSSQAGLIGGIAALLFLTQPVWLLLLGRRKNWRVRQFWYVPISLALFGWLTHSLADFNLMIPGTMLTVAALAPLLIQRDECATSMTSVRTTPIWAPLLTGALATCALAMLPGEKAYQEMETALRLGNVSGARKHLKIANKKMVHSPHPSDTFARAMAAHNAYADAEKYWKIAIGRAPHRSGFRLRLAEIYIKTGRIEDAEKELAEAEYWYPHSKNLAKIRQQLSNQSSGPSSTP